AVAVELDLVQPVVARRNGIGERRKLWLRYRDGARLPHAGKLRDVKARAGMHLAGAGPDRVVIGGDFLDAAPGGDAEVVRREPLSRMVAALDQQPVVVAAAALLLPVAAAGAHQRPGALELAALEDEIDVVLVRL